MARQSKTENEAVTRSAVVCDACEAESFTLGVVPPAGWASLMTVDARKNLLWFGPLCMAALRAGIGAKIDFRKAMSP